ncbi:MAG: acyl-CoA dehydrogenase [Candidatus Marinimicrobia bacterium]|jgi:alkylation response protein AidB-like acyl-CoA dehydrogenase|nr:acyl-CoA dehydrogenase [Candidatus Neomarinimicrobiota bacterium]
MTKLNETDIVAKVRKFLAENLIPLEEEFLLNGFLSVSEVLEEKRQLAKKEGLWTPYLPESDGGLGLSLTQFAAVSEELGRTPLGHYVLNCQAPDIGNIELVSLHGTADQKRVFLEPLIRGEIRSCFAMTEPENPGSNPVLLDTSAEKDGDNYLINGQKWFTSSADGASFTVVMAVTNPQSESKYGRASMILVPMDASGLEIVENTPVMGGTGEGYASHSELRFTDCRVPSDNLLGPEGEGFRLAQERLGPGRIHHCMRWIGICERAFDLMCRHASRRRITSDSLLADQAIVRAWVAESRAEINSARLMVLDAAEKVERQGTSGARAEISLIKFYVADILQKVLDRAIQTHGALGVTDYTPLAYWYRHERAARIYDGPDEVHKLSAAKQILKKYDSE